MNKSLRILIAIVVLAACSRPARADVQVDEQDGGLTVFKLRVTPAAQPAPHAHRLVLCDFDTKAGNAASFYYRAIMAVDEGAKAAPQTSWARTTTSGTDSRRRWPSCRSPGCATRCNRSTTASSSIFAKPPRVAIATGAGSWIRFWRAGIIWFPVTGNPA